jgi:hypothetical protein
VNMSISLGIGAALDTPQLPPVNPAMVVGTCGGCMRRYLYCSVLLGACTSTVMFESSDLQIDASDADSTHARLCVTDLGGVYATWVDARDGADAIWLARSLDRGETFEAPVRVSHGQAQSLSPELACASLRDSTLVAEDAVYVVWEDTRDSELENRNIYFQRSLDAGATWLEADWVVSPDPEGRSMHLGPRVVAGNSEVYVTWFDGRSGAFDVYVQGSTTRAETWNDPVRLDGDTTGAGYSAWPDIASDGEGHCYVAWEDSRDGASDIYVAATGNGGFSFSQGQRLDLGPDVNGTADAPGSHDSFRPRISTLGSSVAVAWHDERFGPARDILMSVSTDHGVAWYDQAVRVEGNQPGFFDSINPAVGLVDNPASSGPQTVVQVAWQDARADAYDVFHRRVPEIADVEETRLDTGAAGGGQSLNVEVATEGSTVIVAWEDRRDDTGEGYNDLYYNVSMDAGETWLENDLRLDNIAPGTSFATDLTVDLLDGEIYALWVDGRNGSADVYFQRLPVGEAAQFDRVPAP